MAIGFLALAVAALSLPGAAIFAVCGIIGAGIGLVNAVTNVATSFRAADAAMDGNPAWAMIYGKQDRLSDVLRQTNFGNGVFNDLSNLGAGAIDITETVCNIVGIAEAGVGASKLFKGDAFKLLKNKGALDLSGLKSGVKNGILDLKSSIKQGYKDLKGGIKEFDNIENDSKGLVSLDFNKIQNSFKDSGEKILSIKELKQFRKNMNDLGIPVKIDSKNKIITNPQAVAAFDPNTGIIYLKKYPTLLSAYHESYHANQFLELGKEKYLLISQLEREEYVYDKIMNNSLFNDVEKYLSQRYIFKVRNGYWPPAEWKGFD